MVGRAFQVSPRQRPSSQRSDHKDSARAQRMLFVCMGALRTRNVSVAGRLLTRTGTPRTFKPTSQAAPHASPCLRDTGGGVRPVVETQVLLAYSRCIKHQALSRREGTHASFSLPAEERGFPTTCFLASAGSRPGLPCCRLPPGSLWFLHHHIPPAGGRSRSGMRLPSARCRCTGWNRRQ